MWWAQRISEIKEKYPRLIQSLPLSSRFAALGEKLNITVHVRVGEDDKPPHSLAGGLAFLTAAGSPPNLKLAVSTAHLVYAGGLPHALGQYKDSNYKDSNYTFPEGK